ncbi:MAG: DUF4397 domain-containing protein [Bacteroidetes bacterium]|nr:DUF4397 domain-containing protein [Bacteroidota bacterium]
MKQRLKFTLLTIPLLLLTIQSAQGQTTYSYAAVGGTGGDCSISDNPCSLTAGITAANDGTLLIQVRRAGGTTTISEDFNLETNSITLGTYARRGTEPVRGTLNFRGAVEFGGENSLTTHPSTTIEFTEIVLTDTAPNQGATIDKITTTGDVLVYSEGNEDGQILVVNELTVNAGHTLTIGTKVGNVDKPADLRVPLKKGETASDKKGILTVNGKIDGTGNIWIAHINNDDGRGDAGDPGANPPISADEFFHTPEEYDLNDNGRVPNHLDCVSITGRGSIEAELRFIAAGNVCVNVPEIGNLVAAGSITELGSEARSATQDSITTDIRFGSNVKIDGDVQQWNDARIHFLGAATTIKGSVILDDGATPLDDDSFGRARIDDGDGYTVFRSECAGGSPLPSIGTVLFSGKSTTIEGDLDIRSSNIKACYPNASFIAPDPPSRGHEEWTSHIDGDLIIENVEEDEERVYLEGRRLSSTRSSAHNLNLDGDIYANNATITMAEPAESRADGLCTGTKDISLTNGTRITLTDGKDHVISGGLTLDALVVLDELDVINGDLTVTTLHVGDGGELEANEDVTVTEGLILQGDGLDGTLDPTSTITKLTYASTVTDIIARAALGKGSGSTREEPNIAIQVHERAELRLDEKTDAENLGLCSGTLLLREAGTDKDSTISVHGTLTVRDGYMEKDVNEPGSIGTDNDGYTLRYVNANERTVGPEWFGARDVVINDSKAVIIYNSETPADIPGHLTISKGHFHVKGADLTVGRFRASGKFRRIADDERYLRLENGELHSNGNNVIVYGPVDVGTVKTHTAKIITDGGNLRVLGNDWNISTGELKGDYQDGTAAVTVSAKSVIDVGMGALQLGPEYTFKKNGLGGPPYDYTTSATRTSGRPLVKLTSVGMVKGKVTIPKGSKRTVLTGESFDTIVLDGTKNPKVSGSDNYEGRVYVVARSGQNVTIDSVSVSNGGADFVADAKKKVTINKNVAVSSASLYQETPTLEFKKDLAISGTGGFSSRGGTADARRSATIGGGFSQKTTQKTGGADMNHPEGATYLSKFTNLTVEGDFTVSGEGTAQRFGSSADTKLNLKGGFNFGLAGDSLNAHIEFSGKEKQSVSTGKVDLREVTINGAGIMLASDVSQTASSTLTLKKGTISGDSSWVIKNTKIEENLVRRSAARPGDKTCGPDDDQACSASILRGSRQSHISAMLTRHITDGNAGGGEVTGGYLFPLGTMKEDVSYYRPAILQLLVDPAEMHEVEVSLTSIPTGVTPQWESQLVQGHNGGLLTLDVYSDIFWKIDLGEDELEDNVNLRVAAAGINNVFDPKGLRIVQWNCDWENPQQAGLYDVAGAVNPATFAVNDYVNGVFNLTQEGIDLGSCSIFGIAANQIENPIHQESLASGRSRVQFVHNAQLPAPVNLSLDGVGIANGLTFQSATGYLHVAAGEHATTLQPVGAPADQAIEVSLGSLVNDRSYAVIAHGAGVQVSAKILETRLTSLASAKIDVLLVHGSADLGSVRLQTINILDDPRTANPTRLLASNFLFDEASNYIQMDPDYYRIEAVSGNNKVAVFDLNLSGYQGQTLIANLSGSRAANNLDLYVVDVNGNRVNADVVTGTESEITEIPTEFTLHGNYPNPFNPSTRIQFDLPESAQVTVQIVDMLGREVMALPAKEFAAGANRSIELNAINLSSGTYLYRMIATGAESRYVKTGRMTLVK